MAGSPGETGGTGDKPWTAEDARKKWAELLSQTQYAGKHIPITRSGKRAAILVPPDWYDRAVASIGDHDDA
jgi:prevent-host-death family protein